MTKAEFAKHRGVSKAAVSQWANAGRIVLTGDGQVDVAASEARLAGSINTRGGKRTKGQYGTAVATSESVSQADLLDGGTLTDARTAQARNRAKLDALEYQRQVGRLVERDRYDAGIADGLAPALARLDSLSARVCPKLGLPDVRRGQDIIDDEVLLIRQEIVDILRSLAAGSAGKTKQ